MLKLWTGTFLRWLLVLFARFTLKSQLTDEEKSISVWKYAKVENFWLHNQFEESHQVGQLLCVKK